MRVFLCKSSSLPTSLWRKDRPVIFIILVEDNLLLKVLAKKYLA